MTGVITGRVVDSVGAPLAGATVTVASQEVPVRDIASLTNAEGGFRRGGLDAGSYTVEVHHPDHPVRSEPVELGDGQTLTREIRLRDPVNDLVNPTGNAGMITVEVEPHLIDWDQVLQVRVGLTYSGSGRGGAIRREYILTGANHDVPRWHVPLSDVSRDTYSYEIEYFMADGSRRKVNSENVREHRLVLGQTQ